MPDLGELLLLLILRHGEAESKSTGKADEERALTVEGKEKLGMNLNLAKEILRNRSVDLILSSPLLRARQSAELAKEILNSAARVEIDSSLESNSEPYEIYQSLTKNSQRECMLLVSHQPLVSRILAGLLNWNDRYFSFKTGAMAIVQVDEMRLNPEGILVSLISHL